MAAALNEDYQRTLHEQKKEVHELVMARLEQIKEGKTKDFNTVCARLEKKYRDEATSNQYLDEKGFFYLANTTYMLYSMIRKKKERIIDDTAQLLL